MSDTMTKPINRWDRLVSDLAAAGIEARLDEKPYADIVRGRVETGVSRSVFIRTPTGSVAVTDQWWRKNPAVWIGYRVIVEDREGIVTRLFPITKKRSEVVAAVLAGVVVRDAG